MVDRHSLDAAAPQRRDLTARTLGAKRAGAVPRSALTDHASRNAKFVIRTWGIRCATDLPYPVESDPQCAKTIAYILENPVRAGMVKKVEDWPWSGLATLRPRDELDTSATQSWHEPVRRAG